MLCKGTLHRIEQIMYYQKHTLLCVMCHARNLPSQLTATVYYDVDTAPFQISFIHHGEPLPPVQVPRFS